MKNLNKIIANIKKNKFLILGRSGIDIYPDPPGTKTKNAKYFVAHLGGSSANIAVALSKSGGKCDLLTCISDDALGQFTLNQLKYYGINTSLIRLVKNESRTSLAIVETTTKDHQSIIYRNNASDLEMNKEDIERIKYKQYSTLIITGTCLASEPSRSSTFEAINLAKKNDITIIFDVDHRPYTWKSLEEASENYIKLAFSSDIIVGNDDEFGIMAGAYEDGISFCKDLNDKSSSVVIYKMGERGSITFSNQKEIKTGVFNVNVLKPTGAGDAFLGVFISSLLKEKTLKDSIVFGSAAAAIVVTKVGCAPAMPTYSEVESFTKNNIIKNFKEL